MSDPQVQDMFEVTEPQPEAQPEATTKPAKESSEDRRARLLANLKKGRETALKNRRKAALAKKLKKEERQHEMEADILAAIVEDEPTPPSEAKPAPEPVQPKPAPVKQVDFQIPDHSDRFDRIERSIQELSNRMRPVKVDAKPVQPPQPQPPAPRPPTPAPPSPEITLSTFGTVPW